MPYSRKELQIIGGSFNLNPPVDKVPIRDYLLCQNFRVDRNGQLLSRYGYPSKFTIGGGGRAHSIGLTGGIEGDWYVATSVSSGGGANALYHNPVQLPNTTPIATGFDGNRVGFVYLNGFMWVMNQGKQGRHDGTGFNPWTITPPAGSCTAAAASAPTVTSSATYTYASQGAGYRHTLVIAGYEYAYIEVAADTAAIIAGKLSLLARVDGNCTVTNAIGTGTLVIAPIASFTAINISGSDSNANAIVGIGTITNLPSGTYTFYVTYQTSDLVTESNPGPVSNAITVNGQAIALTGIPLSPDSRVGIRNIYAAGGTLGASSGQAYLVGSIQNNSSTTFTDSLSDSNIIAGGSFMPTTNDFPPAAYGMCGAYYSRLVAWNTIAHPNRLFFTDPAVPQYWPGAANPATGNWIDVGDDGEQIIWCTQHTNILVIYKERSIWEFVGDFETGYLQMVSREIGLSTQFGVCECGAVDVFVGPNGLFRFDVDHVLDITGNVRPLFNTSIINSGPLSSPGSILPGPFYLTNTLDAYSIALGYGMGKLYIAYAENAVGGPGAVTLVYSIAENRWVYHRTAMPLDAWSNFVFDGVLMVGVGRDSLNNAVGYSLDDFRGFASAEPGGYGIECVYGSHYEDCGLPDNEKVWLEVVVDISLNVNGLAGGAGQGGPGADTATVYVSADNGMDPPISIGTIAGIGRQSVGFPLGTDANGEPTIRIPGNPNISDGHNAKNLQVLIDVNAGQPVIIHNVYLYYYEEARLATAATTIPTDLGMGKMKQVKELELDIEALGGPVDCNLYSDLPGNALAVRQTPVVNAGGRGMFRYPFPKTQGYLWRLALTATAGPFRLYSARLLARMVGVYVEAYESAAGFVWDSEPLTFDSGLTKIPRMYQIALAALPIKRARELSLEIETFSSQVIVSFLSDLPGDALTVRFTQTVNTGTAGRRFVRIPLPDGTTGSGGPFPNGWIEGRMFQLQISGAGTFILYEAALELIAIGVYIEAYEAAGGALYDSREVDLGSPNVKEFTELELDIETSGPVSVQFISDQVAGPALGNFSTNGRQKIMLPLTVSEDGQQYAEGRLARLMILGANAFRLYDARVKARAFGQYLLSSETSLHAIWDSTALDLGTQTVKQLREIELEIWAYGPVFVKVYTDLPGNIMALRQTAPIAIAAGHTTVQIPLPQGNVPDNYLFGRLVRVVVDSTSSFKLFGARIHARPIGLYVESYEAAGGAVWDSTAVDLGSNNDKQFDTLQFEMDADGSCTVEVFTDLPGEQMASRGVFNLTNAATARRWVTVPLPSGLNNGTWGIEGRSIQLIVRSSTGFRLYKVQVRSSRVGRYLAAAPLAAQDKFSTLEFDFSSERVKVFKSIDIDMRADGNVTLNVLTSQTGSINVEYTPAALTTPLGRDSKRINIPPGIRGRLLRLSFTSPAAARIFHLRVLARPLNEDAPWKWIDYPAEESEVLPTWSSIAIAETPSQWAWQNLPVPPTPPTWEWAPFSVNPTEPQFFWGKILSVEETPDVWAWVDLNMQVLE